MLLSKTDLTLLQVLAEIDRPMKKFKYGAGFGVFAVSILFLLVNIIYVRYLCRFK
jgi:hypothetical protein